jgi:hypothetical protein
MGCHGRDAVDVEQPLEREVVVPLETDAAGSWLGLGVLFAQKTP